MPADGVYRPVLLLNEEAPQVGSSAMVFGIDKTSLSTRGSHRSM